MALILPEMALTVHEMSLARLLGSGNICHVSVGTLTGVE